MKLRTGLVSGDRHVSVAEHDERVRRAAVGFTGLGIGVGDCVALLLRNDFAFIEATSAAQRLGAYAVPINWHFKAEEIRYILEDCDARALVVHADLIAGLADAVPAGVSVLVVETPPEIIAAYRIAPDLARPAPGATVWEAFLEAQDPALAAPPRSSESMIYTSGTTGRPKAVRRQLPTAEQAAKVIAMRTAIYGLEPGMRTAVSAPLYHSAPNSYGMNASRQGGLLMLLPRFDPEQVLAMIEQERLTHMFMVPTMFVRLTKLPPEVKARYDISSMRFIIHAGAPCPPDVKEAMIAWFGPIVHEFYGGTESGPAAYCTPQEWLAHRGTVGRAIDEATIEVITDDGRKAGVGETGEIFMRIHYYPDFTYHNQDEKRREIDRDGLITCGDVGYFDEDGFLYICDRKRDMVIVGGVNVYPAEIEAALAAMPGVRDCAVFGIPDAEYGEALIALVQPFAEGSLTAEAVRAYLKSRIADYKVPRRIEFRAELPREDSGKIFKRVLREPYWRDARRAI
ncbi:Long-chain-fatty-acid--CoA ligase FadD13 [bacterium YEK0313]|nr:Long-chain-fatty-acid--CoA ligase FadD13 [bacterium YEK0313]